MSFLNTLGQLFDFSAPDFDAIDAKIDRYNELQNEDRTFADKLEADYHPSEEEWQQWGKGDKERIDIYYELMEYGLDSHPVQEEEYKPWWKLW